LKIKGGNDRLGRGINKVRKEMEKFNALTPALWKGRKIVSFDEWRTIFYKRHSEVFDYIPNDYVPGILTYFPNDDSESLGRWHLDYLTFLVRMKNPKVGQGICGKCILSGANKNYDSMGINEIVFKDMQETSLLHEEDQPEIKVHLERPCPVEDWFRCPYQNEKFWHESMLQSVGYVISMVCDAIRHAHNLTYNNDTVFCVNFDSGHFHSINRLGRERSGSIKRELEDVKISKVYVRTVDDVHHVLTDEQTLREVLDQYPFANENPESREEAIKLAIKHFIIQLKGRISLEELRDPTGMSLEESRRTYESLDQQYPDFPDNYNSLCSICSGHWANIRCTRCDIATCPDHWRQHKQEVHPLS
jgi:hypothetical protein